MKLQVALLSLLAGSVQAFSPNKAFLPKTLTNAGNNGGSELWRPPMNMVAGGAERATGEEYYDGTKAAFDFLS